jgi:hypothetical protein
MKCPLGHAQDDVNCPGAPCVTCLRRTGEALLKHIHDMGEQEKQALMRELSRFEVKQMLLLPQSHHVFPLAGQLT